jgi:hypothetical protein
MDYGVLVGPHLASAAAELEKWDQGKRQLKGQYHLQRRSKSQEYIESSINHLPALFGRSRREEHLIIVTFQITCSLVQLC